MLSREEIRRLNDILKNIELVDEDLVLKEKLSLIVEQISVMKKAQEDTAKIQDKIEKLNKNNEE